MAVLAGILIGSPRSAQAALWSSDTVAAYGFQAELEELRATRERIVHRQALRRSLLRRVRALSGEIGAARRRADQAGAEIADQQDALRAQERALDRVVPRLIARLRATEQRRGQAARALADLASLGRRRELDPKLRARMRALGPVLLAVLRNHDAAGVALTQRGDRVIEERRRVAGRIPVLDAEIRQLQERRETLIEQRRSAFRRLVGLDTGLRRLTGASTRLARRMVVVEFAYRARAEGDVARPARDRAGMRLAGAAVRGRAVRSIAVAQTSEPHTARAMTTAGAAGQARRLRARLEPDRAVLQPLSLAARVWAARHDAAMPPGDSTGPTARPGPVAMSVATLSSRVAPAHLQPPAPIRPSRAVARARFDNRGRETGVMISAVPGQRVAAPQDGRVVFADAFKGYGLLLIIEHDSEYHTLLWGFSKLRVGVGDEVRGGEIIGVMDVVDGLAPQLGVELRRRGRPVNPLPWLAGSSSKVRG